MLSTEQIMQCAMMCTDEMCCEHDAYQNIVIVPTPVRTCPPSRSWVLIDWRIIKWLLPGPRSLLSSHFNVGGHIEHVCRLISFWDFIIGAIISKLLRTLDRSLRSEFWNKLYVDAERKSYIWVGHWFRYQVLLDWSPYLHIPFIRPQWPIFGISPQCNSPQWCAW